MQSSFQKVIGCRGWHVYGKNVRTNPKRGDKLFAVKEKNPQALTVDPYSIAWMLKRVDKLSPEVVGHIPQEISRFVWFFLESGGTVNGEVLDGKCRRSPIANGGLEIILKVSFCISDLKRRYLERLMELINKNYDASEGEFEEILEANLDSQESDSDDLGEPGPMIMIDDECNHTEDDSPVTKNPDVLIIDD